jgi:hypothetical protein
MAVMEAGLADLAVDLAEASNHNHTNSLTNRGPCTNHSHMAVDLEEEVKVAGEASSRSRSCRSNHINNRTSNRTNRSRSRSRSRSNRAVKVAGEALDPKTNCLVCKTNKTHKINKCLICKTPLKPGNKCKPNPHQPEQAEHHHSDPC